MQLGCNGQRSWSAKACFCVRQPERTSRNTFCTTGISRRRPKSWTNPPEPATMWLMSDNCLSGKKAFAHSHAGGDRPTADMAESKRRVAHNVRNTCGLRCREAVSPTERSFGRFFVLRSDVSGISVGRREIRNRDSEPAAKLHSGLIQLKTAYRSVEVNLVARFGAFEAAKDVPFHIHRKDPASISCRSVNRAGTT